MACRYILEVLFHFLRVCNNSTHFCNQCQNHSRLHIQIKCMTDSCLFQQICRCLRRYTGEDQLHWHSNPNLQKACRYILEVHFDFLRVGSISSHHCNVHLDHSLLHTCVKCMKDCHLHCGFRCYLGRYTVNYD